MCISQNNIKKTRNKIYKKIEIAYKNHTTLDLKKNSHNKKKDVGGTFAAKKIKIKRPRKWIL